jgi:hypothetical protein
MKIKIPPHAYPIIAEESLVKISPAESANKDNFNHNDSNNYIVIAKHEGEKERVYQMLGIKHDEKQYISVLPSPTHLFLTSSLEFFEFSKKIKSDDFIRFSKRGNDTNLFILDFEYGCTNQSYTSYIKAVTSSIIMLVSALESFMNQIIPKNFSYRKEDKNGEKNYNHKKIENGISFKEKLELVVPLAINQKDFWRTRSENLDIINELYNHRKNMIHLKTKSEDELNRYSVVFSEMLSFDLLKAINATINIFNSIEENFVEIEEK